MKRIATPNRAVDLFGAGKDGYRAAVAGVSTATEFSALWFNHVQEALARTREAAGIAVPADGDHDWFVAALNVHIQGARNFLNATVFDASGTFVVPAGVTKIRVQVWGGGGGGGSLPAAINGAAGGGGGAGGFGVGIYTVVPAAVYMVTIGAKGSAVVGASGGSGGTTSFGALISATGGVGGNDYASGAMGGLGGICTGGNAGNWPGACGQTAAYASGVIGGTPGGNGAGICGGRGAGANTISASPGGPGSGGGGGGSYSTTSKGESAEGGAGRVIVNW